MPPAMKKDIVNPFAQSDLRLPARCVDDVRKYTATFSQEEDQAPDPDRTPFRRYVDMWWVGMAIGASEGKMVEEPPGGWHKFIEGTVLQTDPWRVVHLQMLGLAWFSDAAVLGDPGKIVARANAYAAYGVPKLLKVMSEARVPPLFEVSHFLRERCDRGSITG